MNKNIVYIHKLSSHSVTIKKDYGNIVVCNLINEKIHIFGHVYSEIIICDKANLELKNKQLTIF